MYILILMLPLASPPQLGFLGYSITTAPELYQTVSACNVAGENWKKAFLNADYRCIRGPRF